jgi:hypothetical protein
VPKLDLAGDERLRRKARSTGTVVALIFYGKDHSDGPWMTLCEDHAGCVHHDTRKLAEGWLSHPEDWCPGCKGEDGVD